MIPASQGGVVATRHASLSEPMEAEGTPIPAIETSTSSDDPSMSSNSHPGRNVRVSQHNRVLNQSMTLMTADPMILAQASEEVARARSETQRVALQAESQVMQTREEARQLVAQASDEVARVQYETQRVTTAAESQVIQTRNEARQAVGNTIMEAEARMSQVARAAEARVSDVQCQAQSMINQANQVANERVSEAQSRANLAVEEMQTQTLARIHDMESTLRQTLDENRQLKSLVEAMKQEFGLKLQAKDSQIQALENQGRIQPQVQGHPHMVTHDQVHHATGLELPIASGPSVHKPKGPVSPSCAGDQGQMFMRVHPQREDQLLQFSGKISSIEFLGKVVLLRAQSKNPSKNQLCFKGDLSEVNFK